MIAILPHVRCQANSIRVKFNISSNFKIDKEIPTLLECFMSRIKLMHNLKSLYMNLDNSKHSSIQPQEISLPLSSEDQQLIQHLGDQYRRLKNIKVFNLCFDSSIHSIFRCFLQKFEALPNMRRLGLSGIDLQVFRDFFYAMEKGKYLSFAAFYPKHQWTLDTSNNLDKVMSALQTLETLIVPLGFYKNGIHLGVFTDRFIRNVLCFKDSETLHLALFGRKDFDPPPGSLVDYLTSTRQFKELTLCMYLGFEDYIYPLVHLQGLSQFHKVNLMLKSNPVPISTDKDMTSLFGFFRSFIISLPLMMDLTVFVDKLSVENIVYVKEIIAKLPRLNSFTFGYVTSIAYVEKLREAMLAGLTEAFHTVDIIKKIVIATSNNVTFDYLDTNYFTGIEQSLISSGKVGTFLFKRVENIERVFYTGRGDLI